MGNSLADLTVRRILLADKVAAAKFGTGQPVDDPLREQQILDTVAERSVRLGLPPDTALRFFRAQIEANKVVQRGLFEHWCAHPTERPSRRPDLATEVRPQLDRITGLILQRLAKGAGATGEMKVPAELLNRLDRLHQAALAVSLRAAAGDVHGP